MSGSYEADDHPAYIGVMLFVCAVAVMLNVLVIVTIYKVSRFRTSVDIFLTNLAISDILQAGVVLPIHFKNLSMHDQDFYGGNVACKIVQFIPLFIVMAAISTMIAIAIDRLRVMLYRKTMLRRESFIVVGVVWLVSCCVSAPQIYEYNISYQTNEETNRTQKSCGSEGIVEHFETIYATIVFVLAYCIPLLILLICYVRISVLVWKHAKRFRITDSDIPNNNATLNTRNSNNLEARLSTRKIKVLKMLITIAVAFILLWTPYFILFAVQEISDMDHSQDVGKWPHLVTRTMTIIATVTDPSIYLFFSDPFRQFLSKTLPCCTNGPTTGPQTQTAVDVTQNKSQGFPTIFSFFSRNKRRIEPREGSPKTRSEKVLADNDDTE